MFSIKFMGSVIFSIVIFPKFRACASLKNYEKTMDNFLGSPKYNVKHWASVLLRYVLVKSISIHSGPCAVRYLKLHLLVSHFICERNAFSSFKDLAKIHFLFPSFPYLTHYRLFHLHSR